MTPSTFENPQYLFVYGTLRKNFCYLPRSIFHVRPPHVLAAAMQWKGKAKLKDHLLYDLGSYPGIVPKPSETSSETVVHGDVFVIENRMLPLFDEYEAIADEYTHPQEYRRIKTTVDLFQDGKWEPVLTWVYEFNWSLSPQHVLVSDGDYVEYCLRKLAGQ